MRILLVEDEEKRVALLQRGLTEEGHSVDVCSEGRAALERGAQDGYEVIILDWALPGAEVVIELPAA